MNRLTPHHIRLIIIAIGIIMLFCLLSQLPAGANPNTAYPGPVEESSETYLVPVYQYESHISFPTPDWTPTPAPTPCIPGLANDPNCG